MVSGHPLSSGVLQVRLTLQLEVSVSLLTIVGGEGTPISKEDIIVDRAGNGSFRWNLFGSPLVD